MLPGQSNRLADSFHWRSVRNNTPPLAGSPSVQQPLTLHRLVLLSYAVGEFFLLCDTSRHPSESACGAADKSPAVPQFTSFDQAEGFLKMMRYIETIGKRLSPVNENHYRCSASFFAKRSRTARTISSRPTVCFQAVLVLGETALLRVRPKPPADRYRIPYRDPGKKAPELERS